MYSHREYTLRRFDVLNAYQASSVISSGSSNDNGHGGFGGGGGSDHHPGGGYGGYHGGDCGHNLPTNNLDAVNFANNGRGCFLIMVEPMLRVLVAAISDTATSLLSSFNVVIM